MSEDIFSAAQEHHQNGRLPDAATLYRRILERDPDHADALHFLGLTELQVGRPQSAVELMTRAARLDPKAPEFHSNLGLALQATGKVEAAAAEFRRAVELDDEYAEAYQNLAAATRKLGKLDESVSAWRRIAELLPQSAEVRNNLGDALVAAGQPAAAVEEFRQALSLRPDSPDIVFNLGTALGKAKKIAEAIPFLSRALELRPDDAKLRNNLGTALVSVGKVQEAIDQYRIIIKSHPDFAPAHFNLGIALLLTGDAESGWKEYEWRWHLESFATFPRPQYGTPWNGSPLNGQRILLYSEQGWGDAIQFFRYAPLVAARGGIALVRVPTQLVKLFQDSSDLQIVSSDTPPADYDFHAPLMSLAGLLHQTAPNHSYLRADPARAAKWAKRFSAISEFKCGIAWAGNPLHPDDQLRSLSSEFLAPLADLPGVRFFSLQKGQTPPPWMTDLSPDLNDFADTAAAAANLDLVIAVDTAVAHLAGAMGRPVWTLVAHAPDWRWLLHSSSTSWYPTMRLFRQETPGDWPGVIDRVASELKRIS
jgi:tetratricopeptide (TPR) repeat protein